MKSRSLFGLAVPALCGGLMLFSPSSAQAQTASSFFESAAENYRTGNFDSAIAGYSKALELNPSFIGAYNGRGLAKCRQGNFDGAIADFSTALQLRPAFTEYYFNRGHAEFLQGNMDAAATDFTRVIEQKPDHSQAYFYRALARYCELNFIAAGSDFAKAQQLQPAGSAMLPSIKLHCALLLLRIGGDAGLQLKSAAEWSDPWAKRLALFLGGKLSEARLLALAEQGVGDDVPRQKCEAWYFLGVTKLIAGQKAAAKADFQKAFDASGPAELVHRLARVELDRA